MCCWHHRCHRHHPSPPLIILSPTDELSLRSNLCRGAPLLLDFITDNVVPAVLGRLGMDLGEVTIAGGSLGGLTLCYAAASRPANFQRAICMSPTNCYNWFSGGLVSVIKQQFKATAQRAKAVIQFLGAGEVYGVVPSPEVAPHIYPQLTFMANEHAAWIAIGMRPLAATPQPVLHSPMMPHIQYGYSEEVPPASPIIMSYTVPGGQHCAETWEKEFSVALQNLYRYEFPTPNRTTQVGRFYTMFPSPIDSVTFLTDSSSDTSVAKVRLNVGVDAGIAIGGVVIAIIVITLFVWLGNAAKASSSIARLQSNSAYATVDGRGDLDEGLLE
jgi:hypothetical protein